MKSYTPQDLLLYEDCRLIFAVSSHFFSLLVCRRFYRKQFSDIYGVSWPAVSLFMKLFSSDILHNCRAKLRKETVELRKKNFFWYLCLAECWWNDRCFFSNLSLVLIVLLLINFYIIIFTVSKQNQKKWNFKGAAVSLFSFGTFKGYNNTCVAHIDT